MYDQIEDLKEKLWYLDNEIEELEKKTMISVISLSVALIILSASIMVLSFSIIFN